MSEEPKIIPPLPTPPPVNPPPVAPKMRQIIIETDGTHIQIVKADVAGSIEFMGVLQFLIREISK